ncbi:MAG: hypothetical protein ACPKPY_11235 [Nitrososphaeraceae archaeon]
MINNIYSSIEDYLFSNSDCTKFCLNDGITSSDLHFYNNPGLWKENKINVKSLKNKHDERIMGKMLSILKNLDYYQSTLCKIIKDLSDRNSFKTLFQKIRYIILGLFLKLLNLLNNKTSNENFSLWNQFSNKILITTSEIVPKYNQCEKFEDHNFNYKLNKDLTIFSFIGLKESFIDEKLKKNYL